MSRLVEKRERLSGEERKAQIIDSALTLFAKKGFAGTTTKEIANAADISETLIFQHFRTKEDLIKAALAVLFHPHPVSGNLKKYLKQTEDDVGFFRAIAIHFIKHNRQDPRVIKLAIHCALEEGHFGELTRVDETGPLMLTIVTEYIQKRIDQGVFVKTNAEITARLFVGMLFMYIADQQVEISGPRITVSDDEIVGTMVDIFVGGLRTRKTK
jgi:AcrR family transcriptional regulator